MFCFGSPILCHFAPPVCTWIVDRIITCTIMFQGLWRISKTGLTMTLIGIIFIHIVSILIRVKHLRNASRLSKSKATIILYASTSTATTLGCYQDNTISCTCTINGTSSSILQHRNTLYVLRIQTAKTTTSNTIHHDKR